MRTIEEIKAEVENLKPVAEGFDTGSNSDDACIAAGAHDALRWALGLAENPVSDNVKGDPE